MKEAISITRRATRLKVEASGGGVVGVKHVGVNALSAPEAAELRCACLPQKFELSKRAPALLESVVNPVDDESSQTHTSHESCACGGVAKRINLPPNLRPNSKGRL